MKKSYQPGFNFEVAVAYNPLSDILASAVLEELTLNPDFAALTNVQKLQMLNSAQQEICDLYTGKLSKDYALNTLTTPTPIVP